MQPKISEKYSDIFLNIENNPLLIKYKKLFELYDRIKSQEFDEILLFTFENQCQFYFKKILDKYGNEYNEQSCKEILLERSLNFFKKSQEYLYYNNSNNNKLLKFNSIAYIKTYIYYYVVINYYHNSFCNFSSINKTFDDENKDNTIVRNMRNIYLLRMYSKKFENFEIFKNFIYTKYKIPTFKELSLKIEKGNERGNQYIFTESFIYKNNFEEFKKIQVEISVDNKNFEFYFGKIQNNFDMFYCALVNKAFSYLYDKNYEKYKEKLKNIYKATKDIIKFDNNGTILFQYLMNYDLYKKNIEQKISEKSLSQDEFEIILYSFRFVLNISTIKNKNCFYKNILKDGSNFIRNNFIPGSFPYINEFIKSYYYLAEEFKNPKEVGYYICSDCGFLYTILPCTYPIEEQECPNKHIIGGKNHICSKKDIRVFPNPETKNRYEIFALYRKWNNSFISVYLEEFKANYVDKYLSLKEKGIMKGFSLDEFANKKLFIHIHIITFRTLNFLLYSFLLASYILNNLTENEIKSFLIQDLFPQTLFGVIKEGWKLLNENLAEIGIDNCQTFFNMIFDKLIEFMIDLDSVDTEEKLDNFENKVMTIFLLK